jgi:dTDP-4-dehydrorhamnose reductase
VVKTILILGSSGMVGNYLISLLKDYHVFRTYYSKKKYEDDTYVDVYSYESLENAFKLSMPDIVINLTGIYNNLEFCEQNKELVMNVNCNALRSISKLANQFNSFLITISTDQVFDGSKGNYKESDKICPINYYGKTKAEGEKIVQSISKKYCIIRTSMLWGKNKTRNTFSEFILDEVKNKKELKLITDQFTCPTYLENFCEMFTEIIKREILGIIHLSGPEKLSRYDFGIKILKSTNNKKIIASNRNEFNFGKHMPEDTSLNTDKVRKLLRCNPEEVNISIEKYLKNN